MASGCQTADLVMNPTQFLLIFGAGVLAGTINSVAGGGSFITFPLLVYFKVPSIPANATSTIALWPGSLASLGAYRREMAAQPRLALVLALVSVAGGTLGAWILLHTTPRTFDVLLPWLTLFATTLFAFGPRISERLKLSLGEANTSRSLAQTAAIQFVISIYGGYYGAGAGIMMLAVLALLGMKNIHAMNAFKTLLSVSFNAAAVVMFILKKIVFWPQAWSMMAGAVLGGYGGAWLARRMPPIYIRRFVIAVGVTTTVYFFLRVY